MISFPNEVAYLFVYINENYYFRVRIETTNYQRVNRRNYLDIELETEDGNVNKDNYITHIQQD